MIIKLDSFFLITREKNWIQQNIFLFWNEHDTWIEDQCDVDDKSNHQKDIDCFFMSGTGIYDRKKYVSHLSTISK